MKAVKLVLKAACGIALLFATIGAFAQEPLITVVTSQSPYSLQASSLVNVVSCQPTTAAITIDLPPATGSQGGFKFVNETPASQIPQRACDLVPATNSLGTDSIGSSTKTYVLSVHGIHAELKDTAVGHWTVVDEMNTNNQGNSLYTGANVLIGSSYTQVFEHVVGAPSSDNDDSIIFGQIEFTYSGTVAGYGTIAVSVWGSNASNPVCVIDFAVPVSSFPFTVPFSCAAFGQTEQQGHQYYQNTYVKTSLTGLTALYSDIADSGHPSSYVENILSKTY
jgi:hypothetical protein